MPYTMNGIGTWYYGKDNHVSYPATCPHCHRYVTLSSYDTRMWFVVLFIPIFPLGKKRVMDSCPACTQHRHMSLADYEREKRKAYAEAEQAFEANPNDPNTANELLKVYGAYQDMQQFDAIVPPVLDMFSDRPELLTTIGMINYHYGRLEQARDHLEAALRLQDDDEVRHVLGFIYTRLSDPDTAAEHFQAVLDNKGCDPAPALLALVGAYQARGRHEEALVWLDRMAELAPPAANSKAFKKARRISLKNRLTNKPVTVNQSRPAKEKMPLASAGLVAGLAFLVIISIYLGASIYMGKQPAVYLVNGLDRPYEVILNGQAYQLSGAASRKITIPEGQVHLQVTDERLQIEPQTLSVHTSLWTRPFMRRLYVINPDAVALIEWNKSYYSENANAAPEPEWQLHTGQSLYAFRGIDYPFQAFPDTIESSSTFAESRTQVTLLDKSEIQQEEIPAVIQELFGYEAMLNHIRKMLYYEPDRDWNLNVLYNVMDAETFTRIIRPGLDMMPVRVEWHRLYQQSLDTAQPDYDLEGEYRKRLEERPDNAALQYLYGRIIKDDPSRAVALFEQSISHPNPCPYGYYALGYDAMMIGEYDTALAYYEKAKAVEPENSVFSLYYYEMLVAGNRLDQALAYCRTQMQKDPSDYSWMQAYAGLLRQQGQANRANEAFEQWCSTNEEFYTAEDLELLRRSDRINTAYLMRDIPGMQEIIGDSGDPYETLILALNTRQPMPDSLSEQADSMSPMWLLLCYIAEHRLGHTQQAEMFLAGAVEQLSKGGTEERYLSDCLNQGLNDPDRIRQLPMAVGMKAVMLTALGVRYPEHRETFFELAKRLNYKKTFPYHFLNTVHSDPG